MKILFKTKITQQIQAAEYWIDDITEQILFGGGKGGGKSILGASLIFGDALIYPETHYFIARQELTDLRKYTVPTIQEVFQLWGLNITQYVKFDGQYNIYTLYNGSKVFLIACKEMPSDPFFERFGSMQMTRGWIEEGGEVSEAAKANLWLSIGRWKNDIYELKKKLLITANPKKGWMKREFIDVELPLSRKFIKSLAINNPYLSADYVKTLSGEKDKVRRQRLFLGNWEYDEDMDALISYDALADAFSNTIVKDNQKYLTVDVARFGEDSTIFSFWDGLELYKIEKYQKQSIAETGQKIKDLAVIEKVPYSNIIIDEDGVGGGIVDHLKGVRGFIANSLPIPSAVEIRLKASRIVNDFTPKINFANLKSQCGWKLAEMINEHNIAFNVSEYREAIIEELTALLRNKEPDSDKKLQLKSKKEVKEDLGRSPDIGDAILMRMWFELRKEAIDENINNQAVKIQQDKFSINQYNLKNLSNK